jgi:extracellular elastinolytic metalloproteinase
MRISRCPALLFLVCTLACASAAAPSQPQTAAAARALAYVRAQAASLGVTPADLTDLVVTSETPPQASGVTHVYVRQRFRGIDIVGADVTVSIARDGSITHQAGALVRDVRAAANRTRPALSRQDATRRAATSAGTTIAADARKAPPARLVYHPVGARRLRLAWQVDIETPDGDHQWVITIDAESGSLLDKFDRVVSDQEDGA